MFVLDEAKLNCKDRIVFNVSTKEIVLLNSTSKKMLKIPCGHHDCVRFDIDYVSNQSASDNYSVTTFQTDLIQSSTPVLVYFWAEWCGPCRSFNPILKEISDEYSSSITLKTLNVDNYPEIVSKYNIFSIPQTHVFVNGKDVKQIIGRKLKDQIIEELKDFIA